MKFFAIPLTKKNIGSFIKEILPYEHICINLSECLKKQKRFFDEGRELYGFIKAESFFSYDKGKKEFVGILFLAAHGVLFHCFCRKIPDNLSEYIINKFLKDTGPISVMGEKETSIRLEELIKQSLSLEPARYENYKLLVLENKTIEAKNFCIKASNNLNSCLEFLKPPMEDAEILCPMEIEYNESEVLAPGVKASPELCLKLLKKRINNNALYAVKKDGEYISKAGINASGFNWYQIGGVFTKPNYRNKGASTANILVLINDSSQYKKNFALFVKLNNPAARQMYRKIGFAEFCDFRISYF